MSNNWLTSNWLDVNPAIFRFWQEISLVARNIIRYRTPVGSFIAEGFTTEAIHPSFNWVDKEDTKLDLGDYDEDDYKADNKLMVNAKGTKKFHGSCVIFWGKLTNKNQKQTSDKQFYYIEPEFISKLETIPGTNTLSVLEFTPTNKGTTLTGGIGTQTLTTAQLSNCLLLGDLTEVLNAFRALIDPIFDDLVALANFNQQTALRVIRISSGIRYLIAPDNILRDPKSRAEAVDFIENFGMNSLLLVPAGMFDADGKQRFEFGLKFGDGSLPSDPKTDRDTHLEAIALHIKISKEMLIGNQIGMAASKTNRQKGLTAYEVEQKDCEDIIRWMRSKRLDDDKFLTYKMKWNPFFEMDEVEKTNMDLAKLEKLIALVPQMKALGMVQQELYDWLRIPLTIDEKLIKEAEKEKEDFMNSMVETDKKEDEEKEPAETTDDKNRK